MNARCRCCPAPIGRTLAKVDRVPAPLVVDTSSGPVRGEAPPAEPPRPSRRRIVLTALLALLVVAGATFALTRGPEVAQLTQADVQEQVDRGIADAREADRQAPTDAALAYQTALPSLVTITTTGVGDDADQFGTGAGVVVSAHGTILTALHVVDGAATIRVRFADGTQASAVIQDQAPASDTAVLAPDRLPQVVVPAVLGGGPQVGDEVFPLGHPLGLTQSLSGGVVSALDRSISVRSGRTLEGLIQFDAAVNPGNSGGPLLNREGQVVGIVTGLANPSQQSFFVGIGFAVPIATAGGVAGSPPQ